jgi:glucose/mannose-6-phosphate isomerase
MATMNELITAFPANLKEALEIADAFQFRPLEKEVRNVLICGMGGSGIGGSLVSKWLEDELTVSVSISKDYTIPSFVNEHTLVIGSSYSGNTEETLSCIEAALVQKAQIICISSGGKVMELGEQHGFDVVQVPGGNPPRTALAYSLVQLINIFAKTGLASSSNLKDIESARVLIEAEELEIKEQARELAHHLYGSVGILYGASELEPMLVRARQQFNENSKMLCWHHVLPEQNHNELVGWGGGDNRFSVVFFENEGTHRRTARRMEITKEKILERTSSVMTITAIGKNLIERSIYLINIVDWASLYLAEKKEVDPIDIAVIDYLKSELSKFK